MQKSFRQRENIPTRMTVDLMRSEACLTAPTIMSTADFSSVASRLCASCGMCCDGVMFHFVNLQPGDSVKTLAKLGLKVARKRKQDCIVQPCPMHTDGRCMIYEARPVRCRMFECQQLHRVAAGGATEAAALAKIAEAKILVAKIKGLLATLESSNPKQPLRKQCENVLSDSPDPFTAEAIERAREQLGCATADLDALLDEHFRIESPHRDE